MASFSSYSSVVGHFLSTSSDDSHSTWWVPVAFEDFHATPDHLSFIVFIKRSITRHSCLPVEVIPRSTPTTRSYLAIIKWPAPNQGLMIYGWFSGWSYLCPQQNPALMTFSRSTLPQIVHSNLKQPKAIREWERLDYCSLSHVPEIGVLLFHDTLKEIRKHTWRQDVLALCRMFPKSEYFSFVIVSKKSRSIHEGKMSFPLHHVSFTLLLFVACSRNQSAFLSLSRRTWEIKSVYFKHSLALILRSLYCAAYVMLSNASLAGVLVSAVIGTIIVVVVITLVVIRLRTREKRRNVGMIPSRRTHDADLQTAPYDLEMELLENKTGNDNNMRIELMAMFENIEDCSNRHFPKGKARSSQDDPGIVENIEIGQLDVKRFISLLWDSQNRRRAVKHFIAASICAALDIQNYDESKSLVQQDYMSFVKSLKTYTSQCM